MSKKIFHHVPNMITCLNLFCGCLSVMSSLSGTLEAASYFIFAAAIFDFFDGFTARLFKAYSAIGKELDSLADVVSFGVAPAFIMYVMLLKTAGNHGFPTEIYSCGWMIAVTAFLIAVFSALRLAKFNIDMRQTDSFIGLPTPANALFICSLAFVSQGNHPLALLAGNMFFLLAVVVVFSFLLISELPLFSLKFKSFDWKKNRIKYLFISFSALILILFHWAGLALVILCYIILSIIVYFFCNRKVSSP